MSRQIHEPLVAQLTGPLEGAREVHGLALSALPSSDDTVWRLRLRPGVSFHDGAPFNAAAVLANVERWRSRPESRALIDDALIDAPRPDLVRFILPAPDRRFDRKLASPQLGIVSPRALEEAAGGEIDPSAVSDSGTGPFELREREPSRLLLARSTQWWGADRGLGPGVDQLEFTVMHSPGERLSELRDGAIQAASGLGRARLRQVQSDPLLTVVPATAGGTAIERSLRGIPTAGQAPPLNGVWQTALDPG